MNHKVNEEANKNKVCIKNNGPKNSATLTKWPQVLIQKANRNSCLCLIAASGGLGGDVGKVLTVPKREERGRGTEPRQRELKTWEDSRRFEKRWSTCVK